jgi:hypothetical protein
VVVMRGMQKGMRKGLNRVREDKTTHEMNKNQARQPNVTPSLIGSYPSRPAPRSLPVPTALAAPAATE